jgi:hypothetical protein
MPDKRLSLLTAGKSISTTRRAWIGRHRPPRAAGEIHAHGLHQDDSRSAVLSKAELDAWDAADQAGREKNYATIVEPVLQAERDDNSLFGPAVARGVRRLRQALHL